MPAPQLALEHTVPAGYIHTLGGVALGWRWVRKTATRSAVARRLSLARAPLQPLPALQRAERKRTSSRCRTPVLHAVRAYARHATWRHGCMHCVLTRALTVASLTSLSLMPRSGHVLVAASRAALRTVGRKCHAPPLGWARHRTPDALPPARPPSSALRLHEKINLTQKPTSRRPDAACREH